jgi:hypothetical protein
MNGLNASSIACHEERVGVRLATDKAREQAASIPWRGESPG